MNRIALIILFAICAASTCRVAIASSPLADSGEPINISGIYPHLAMFNDQGECGTGAIVPWADRLWVITYSPHRFQGSTDKLYEITPEYEQIIRPESIGGTPANRMIHRESNQLFIGPYVIDDQRGVRVISWRDMPGRLTGNARHLTDPAGKIYFATMEEALYSVDVDTLKVKEHIADGNLKKATKNGVRSALPGYHGKGLYSGQGSVIYANNGEKSRRAKADPTVASGALAQWFGTGDWQLVRRNQFTEVTGPGGIYGSAHPESDPVWAVGWDAKSLLLAVLENGQWTFFRLPKGSHSYDGAHGWNTEWPRIREIGETDLLMTMHGTFWRFPKTFCKANTAGIAPRSNYLKVVGDFAKWNDKLVLGCDDSAKLEFLNKRAFKAEGAAPKQSNSNLWFIEPSQLDEFGPVIGRGSVWLNENVEANVVSDPYLFDGYDFRQLYLKHSSPNPVTYSVEVDVKGNNQWTNLREITVDSHASENVIFDQTVTGIWVRVRAQSASRGVTANFQYRNQDKRSVDNSPLFTGVSVESQPVSRGGMLRSLAFDTLGVVVPESDGSAVGYYELNPKMEFSWIPGSVDANQLLKETAQPKNAFRVDAASIVMEEAGQRYRFPKNDAYLGADGVARVCREVATERDLLNLHGTFYELPARNAQGLAKVRPIATHNLAIQDFCSHAGLLFFTGLDATSKSDHIFRSPDGKAALWAGVVDDLWKLGKPRGEGGPWKDFKVKAGQPSDPFLMTGYDKKSVFLSSDETTQITMEVDVDGTGVWAVTHVFELKSGQPETCKFPEGFSAYWVRVTSSQDTLATAWFTYE